MSEITKEFKDWACSFSGCDGGNPKSKVWLCGIEYAHSGIEEVKKAYYKNILKEKTVGINTNYNFFSSKEEGCMKYRGFNQNFAKVYNAYLGDKAENYLNLLDGNNEILKLNLYPIAFQNTNSEHWKKYNLEKITGFKDKYLYTTWCFFNRSQVFRELREEHKPKLIICIGTSYLLDFIMFFGEQANINNSDYIVSEPLKANSKKNQTRPRVFYRLKVGETLLVIIPFLSGSASGLNSYYLWNLMGNRIRELLNDKT